MSDDSCIDGIWGGSYPSPSEHEEILARTELWQARAEVLRLWSAGRSGPAVSAVCAVGLCDGHESATAWRLSCGHYVTDPPRWYGGRLPETVPCVACGGQERSERR